MKKKIHVISIYEGYLSIISKQLDTIFGDKASISQLIIKDLDSNKIKSGDVVILSRKDLYGIASPFIPKECEIIIGHREINIVNAKPIMELPDNQKLLIVNDSLENAEETVASLKDVFFNHEYLLLDPQNNTLDIYKEIDYIITPGEMEFVPSKFSNVFDIGDRLLSYKTIWKVAEALDMGYSYEKIVNRYMKSQVYLAEPLKNKNLKKGKELNIEEIDRKIETHGFLQESIEILKIYLEGKSQLKSFGRLKLKAKLESKGVLLSEQQLRLRLETLHELKLINVRQGRSGTIITDFGEKYLKEKIKN